MAYGNWNESSHYRVHFRYKGHLPTAGTLAWSHDVCITMVQRFHCNWGVSTMHLIPINDNYRLITVSLVKQRLYWLLHCVCVTVNKLWLFISSGRRYKEIIINGVFKQTGIYSLNQLSSLSFSLPLSVSLSPSFPPSRTYIVCLSYIQCISLY